MKTLMPDGLTLAGTVAAMMCAGLLMSTPARSASEFPTKTPIKHIVVIFQENVSFDHYFGTYPHAQPNKDGSRFFDKPRDDTPTANTLLSAGLLTHNPNGANPLLTFTQN